MVLISEKAFEDKLQEIRCKLELESLRMKTSGHNPQGDRWQFQDVDDMHRTFNFIVCRGFQELKELV